MFFEPGEPGQALGPGAAVAEWTAGEDVATLGISSKYCPCRGHRMEGYRLAFNEERLDVDVCQHCHGVWLDRREVRQLKIVIDERRLTAGDSVAVGRGMLWLNTLIGLPIEERNPVWRSTHWVTVLLALLAGIYLCELAFVDDDSIAAFIENFALIPAKLWRGEAPWTLITNVFVHAGLLYVIAILTFLKIFGDNVEDKLGGRRLLMVFLVSGCIGSIVHVLTHARSPIPILGADAALAGIIGAYVVLFPRIRIWSFFSLRLSALAYAAIWVVAQSIAASIDLLELVPTRVAWLAHLAGFATGTSLTLRYRAQRLHNLAAKRAAAHRSTQPSQ